MCWCAQKTATLTLIQHTVPPSNITTLLHTSIFQYFPLTNGDVIYEWLPAPNPPEPGQIVGEM